MTHEEDPQLTKLLLQDAPPARDPLFRVKVLERRQRKWFRHRALLLLGTLLAVIVIAALGISTGGKMYQAARVFLFGVALAMVGILYAPVLARFLRRLI